MKNFVLACVLSLVTVSPALAQCQNGVCRSNSKPVVTAPVRVVKTNTYRTGRPVRTVGAGAVRRVGGAARRVGSGACRAVARVLCGR